jgi:hypothetical protein
LKNKLHNNQGCDDAQFCKSINSILPSSEPNLKNVIMCKEINYSEVSAFTHPVGDDQVQTRILQ